jgi:hypothetical protein
MHKAPARRLVAAGLVVLACVVFALSFHHPASRSNVMNQTLQIELGQKGAEVVKQSPVPITGGGVNGLLMFDAGGYRRPIEPAAVVFKDAYRAITFPPVERLSFYEEGGTGEGIDEISIKLLLPRMPKNPADTQALAEYDEAVRKIVQEMIDRINAAQWQRWIMFYKPRLSGRDTIAFLPGYRNSGYADDEQDVLGIDPSYRLTREDWDNLADKWAYWFWIKNGASITMRYQREVRHDREDQFLFESLVVDIRSANSTSGGFYGETKGEWMKFKQSEMLRMLAKRKGREAAAKAAGAQILEDYKDYPVGGVRLPEAGQ